MSGGQKTSPLCHDRMTAALYEYMLMRITSMWSLHKTPVLCTPFNNYHISIIHNKKINTTTSDY
jgi:hypothetical protein